MNKRFENKNTGLLQQSDLRTVRGKISYWMIFAILMLCSLVFLLPVIWVLLSGFKDTREFLSVTGSIFPESYDFSKFATAFGRFSLGKYYINSFALVAGQLVFSITVTGLGGYALSRIKPIGSQIVATLILWTLLFPGSMSLIPLFQSFCDLPYLHINLTDSYWPVFLMAGANAFNVLLFKSFFDGIPMSYLEASKIDGASNMGIFFKIILPLSKPIVMVVAIFTFNGAWSAFLWPYLIIKSDNIQVLAVKLYTIKGSVEIAEYMRILLFSIIPPAIMFSLFSKQIMGGLNMSGIKG